jgi:hypothetical protein
MRQSMLLAAAIVALAPGFAAAEVVDSAGNGFTARTTLNIQASPDEVYGRLIHNIGDWWNPAHTFSGDAHNLSIEEKAMGCWCEKLPGGGVARHMEAVYLAPGKTIVFLGGLGPLQSMAATGSLTIRLAPAAGGTKLEATYAVTGYLAGGMNTLAAPVDSVLAEQFTRLKSYIEQPKHP